eukprot:8316223-Alexandrium_andersonii.AAC.1
MYIRDGCSRRLAVRRPWHAVVPRRRPGGGLTASQTAVLAHVERFARRLAGTSRWPCVDGQVYGTSEPCSHAVFHV